MQKSAKNIFQRQPQSDVQMAKKGTKSHLLLCD